MTNVFEAPNRSDGSLNAAIANAVVRLTHEYTGRGATGARTITSGNLVTVLMTDLLTRAERKLAANGKTDTVIRLRAEVHATMRDDLVAAVELLTERKVLAFMSANHVEPDMAIQAFVLEANSSSAA
jgi:uncharacterized protein YbcI